MAKLNIQVGNFAIMPNKTIYYLSSVSFSDKTP